MNVIISQDKSVRFTQESSSAYNLQEIQFYISKQIIVEDIILQLQSLRSVYPFVLVQVGDSVNYDIYQVYFTQVVNLSAKDYNLVLVLNTEAIDLGTHSLQAIRMSAPVMRFMNAATLAEVEETIAITDAHEPIEIIDRDIMIAGNKNVIVAEDNISQEIRFRITKTYDGVDLSTKSFYLDYLVTEIEYEQKVAKLYNELLKAEEDPTDASYLILSLVVPYRMTKTAGSLPFAISVVDATVVDGNQYIWQTKPSSLTIQKNLFKRNGVPVQNPEQTDYEEIVSQIDALEQTVDEYAEATDAKIAAIENSDIYSIDENTTDEEVIFGGGGAPIEEV